MKRSPIWEKWALVSGFLICCVFLGYHLIGSQKYVSARDRFNLQNELQSVKQELENLKNRKTYLSDKLSEMELAYYDLSIQFDDVLRSELTDLEAFSGKRDLYGPGIVIFVQDGVRELNRGESVNNLLVHDGDIRSIVEELRGAGAEAISVNDERILYGVSDIVCVGPVILVNDKPVAPPYIIRAIGNRKTLEATMNVPGGYLDILRGYGIRVEVDTAKYLEIKKHGGIK